MEKDQCIISTRGFLVDGAHTASSSLVPAMHDGVSAHNSNVDSAEHALSTGAIHIASHGKGRERHTYVA